MQSGAEPQVVGRPAATQAVEAMPAPIALVPATYRGFTRKDPPAADAAVARPPAADRIVQVRIGAIEIVGATPPPPAPAAPLATSPPTQRAHGFEDFAALRAYAPIRW
jgi:hypothetical protein